MEDADDFHAGGVRKLAVKDNVISKVSDDPRADIFPAAKAPKPSQGGIARKQIETIKNGVLDSIGRIEIVGTDVIVDDIHIFQCLLGKNEISHGCGDAPQRVFAGSLQQPYRGYPCLHRVD